MQQLISENVQDIISFSTKDGIVRYCTPSMRDILGYEPEEFIGKTTTHLYHPEDLEYLYKQDLTKVDRVSYRTLHKNGHYVWVESTF